MDDFERRLRTGLRDLTADISPSAELRASVAATPDRRPRRRPPVLALAAAALVAVAIAGVAVTGAGGGPDDLDVASDSQASSTTADTTTSTLAPLDDAPPAEPTPVPDVTTTAVEATSPQAIAPTAGPTNTPALVCRDSTDPACGEFRWDPAPVNRPATVTAWIDGDVRAGEYVRVHFSIEDPDGPADASRNIVDHNGPGSAIGATSITNEPCPPRFGPWTPPAPSGGIDTSFSTISINEPGTFVVTVTVDAPQGCDNVNPYLSGGSFSFEVEVLPAEQA